MILDQLRTRDAYALHDEVETVVLAFDDAVVVDRCAQALARARIDAREAQRCAACGKRDGGRPCAVGDAHDERFAPAVLEELLDSVGKRGWLPEAAKELLELCEARH